MTLDKAVPLDKDAVRRHARHARRRCHQESTDTTALALRDHVCAAPFLNAPDSGKTGPVAAYWPVGNEIDPRPVLHAMTAMGIVCALPVIVAAGHPLLFRLWRPDMTLVTGKMGIKIPDDTSPQIRPRIVFTPLLAFDRRGHRLGYGGGYYDRTLQHLRRETGGVIACGLAFAGQLVAHVPHDDHDQPLDWVATETQLIACPAPRPASAGEDGETAIKAHPF